jgi:hypothetical protein
MSERASAPQETTKVSPRGRKIAGFAIATGLVFGAGILNANADGGGSACNPEIKNCTPGTTVPGQESTSTTGFNDKGTTTPETVVTTTTTEAATTTTIPGATTSTTEAGPTTTTEVPAGPETPTPTVQSDVPQAAPTS